MKLEMKEALLELPDKIKQKEISIVADNAELEELNIERKLLANAVGVKVCDETYEDSKGNVVKRYPNQQKRDIEIRLRLDTNENYKNYTNKLGNLKNKLETGKIELDFLKRMFRSYEAVSRVS